MIIYKMTIPWPDKERGGDSRLPLETNTTRKADLAERGPDIGQIKV